MVLVTQTYIRFLSVRIACVLLGGVDLDGYIGRSL